MTRRGQVTCGSNRSRSSSPSRDISMQLCKTQFSNTVIVLNMIKMLLSMRHHVLRLYSSFTPIKLLWIELTMISHVTNNDQSRDLCTMISHVTNNDLSLWLTLTSHVTSSDLSRDLLSPGTVLAMTSHVTGNVQSRDWQWPVTWLTMTSHVNNNDLSPWLAVISHHD